MKAMLEVIAAVLLLAALAGACIVVWGLARGGFDDIPNIGIVLVVVGGIPVATRFGYALRGMRRLWGWVGTGAS